MKASELHRHLMRHRPTLKVFVTDARNGISESCGHLHKNTFHKDNYAGGEILDDLAEGEEFLEIIVG